MPIFFPDIRRRGLFSQKGLIRDFASCSKSIAGFDIHCIQGCEKH